MRFRKNIKVLSSQMKQTLIKRLQDNIHGKNIWDDKNVPN